MRRPEHRGWAALWGARGKWVTLAVALLLSALALAFGGAAAVNTDPAAALPKGAESATVTRLSRELPSGQALPALVVYSRAGGLTEQDKAAIGADAARVAALAMGGRMPPPVYAGDVALLTVPLSGTLPIAELTGTVGEIRAEVRDGLPSGARAEVTGGAGFKVDLAAVFQDADLTLLAVTAGVVALLLLITYRSPWLWLVPLSVIGLADQVAAKVVAILTRVTGLTVDDSTLGITSVLVFGAGTNYALLLIARYREQLRHHDDRHAAMTGAVRSAAPAILASSATVTLALATLSFAASPFTRGIGLAGAIGIVTAVAYALLVLPAAMVIFGRGLFWPFAPKVGQDDPSRTGPWSRAGHFVARRPVLMTVLSVGLLAVLAAGGIGLRSGLAQTEQFRDPVEAIAGQQTLSRAFPADSGRPAVIITGTAAAEQVRAAAASIPAKPRVTIVERTPRHTRVEAVLGLEPGTPESFAAIRQLRAAVHAVPGASAVVGGPEASDLDDRDAAARDQRLIIPLVLGVVLLVLLVLLRSLVAAVTLVLTVVASFAAAFGASWFAFTHFFGFPALDLDVPLLSFLFLVALGVDYNIFLTTRAREETPRLGTRQGIVAALAVTGGVITSAGVLLAAVFAVLGVLPLITLTQIGVIVGFGVLLDTLLVRSVLVPALVTLLGDRFWWPGTPQAAAGDAEQKEAGLAYR
ncbi:membrane protein [Sphaerisporangium melleum]|uniref:Membrane protein n=1 Tax=Sphaerisporangium melleum TaxID=321316 RepID=A0A917VH37_9ACTN|nr:MMPL family transporter [Sphaerisporangium melleum]GGK80791.1 membrane protein [Sphaerisporangium melleum]GII72003.1 membrane protein [Sphaerisporangium melleum]